MKLTKTSLYSPDDLIELLRTSGAPLSKIAEETAIPEPTLKNYKYGKTLIDSMPYRIVVELSRFFRQYDLNVEKLKTYGHVILPKDMDSIHFEYMFGGEFKENPHLYALRVLHLFTSRSETVRDCDIFKREYGFEHVFVAISPEIIKLIVKLDWFSINIDRMFEKMTSLNITCVWSNSMFKDLYRYFNDEPNKYDFVELYDSSIKTERLMSNMRGQLFTSECLLDELEYVEDLFSNVAIQYLLVMFGIDPIMYNTYREELSRWSGLGIECMCDGLFTEKRVMAEYKGVAFKCNEFSVKDMVKFRQFQLQTELYRTFDLEISQKYNFDEMLRKGTYEKLFE